MSNAKRSSFLGDVRRVIVLSPAVDVDRGTSGQGSTCGENYPLIPLSWVRVLRMELEGERGGIVLTT
jgi:hypothetical protein